MKNDQRREQLEQLAAENDEAAISELWIRYGVDRQAAQTERT